MDARSEGSYISLIVPPPFAMPTPVAHVSLECAVSPPHECLTAKESRDGPHSDQHSDIRAESGRYLQQREYREANKVEQPSSKGF